MKICPKTKGKSMEKEDKNRIQNNSNYCKLTSSSTNGARVLGVN